MSIKLGHHSMTWMGWWNKNKMAFDLARLLQEVGAAGYSCIELGGDEKSLGPARDVVKAAGNAGLEIAAWGAAVTYNPWAPNTEQFKREMDYAAAAGVKTLAVCGGFMPEQRRNTFEHDYRIFADNLAVACQHAVLNGQTVAFHPHRGCIVETNAEVEILLRHLPHVKLCVDTGHSISVLSDPVELFRKHPDKIAHVHLKDWDPETRKFAEIGYGKAGLDFGLIFAVLDQIGYQGSIIVERDDPPMDPPASARMSRDFLRRFVP